MASARRVEESAEILEAFERTVSREAYNLSRWPELTWQQLHNRLQWEYESIPEMLEAERRRRTAPGSPPWIRTRTPFLESRGLTLTLRGHDSGVHRCAISPDGRHVVSASYDNTLKIWDPRTGVELRTLSGHTDQVWGCAISPDGSYIVSASWDQTVRIWNPRTGEELRTLRGHSDQIKDCATSPDGRFVVSGGNDKTLKIWDPRTGAELRTLSGHSRAIETCAVSPDGRFVVSGAWDRTLRVWDTKTGQTLRVLEGHGKAFTGLGGAGFQGLKPGVFGCAISPDGSFIVSVAADRTVRIWDTETGKTRHTLKGHTGWAWGCAISPDGSFVASSDTDGALKIWDPRTGRELKTLRGHSGAVCGCAIWPDGSRIVSAGSWDHTLKFWEPEREGTSQAREGHEGWVFATRVSPDGSSLFTAGEDGKICEWDSRTGRLIRTFGRHDLCQDPQKEGAGRRAWDCAVGPDGSVYSAGEDGTFRQWNPKTGRGRILGRQHTEMLACAAAPDGSYVVSAGAESPPVKIWDPEEREVLRGLLGHTHNVGCCAVSPDASMVVSASTDKTLRIWDARTGSQRRAIKHPGPVGLCAVSPDGDYILAASDDERKSSGGEEMTLWDRRTGRRVQTFRGHSGNVYDCAVTADGAHVISTGGDGILRVWDVASGRQVGAIVLPGTLTSFAELPRGGCLAAGDVGGNLHLMDIIGIDPGPLVVTAIERGDGLLLRCPDCADEFPAQTEWLGTVIACPRVGCGRSLRVNSFVVNMARKERSGLRALLGGRR